MVNWALRPYSRLSSLIQEGNLRTFSNEEDRYSDLYLFDANNQTNYVGRISIKNSRRNGDRISNGALIKFDAFLKDFICTQVCFFEEGHALGKVFGSKDKEFSTIELSDLVSTAKYGHYGDLLKNLSHIHNFLSGFGDEKSLEQRVSRTIEELEIIFTPFPQMINYKFVSRRKKDRKREKKYFYLNSRAF